MRLTAWEEERLLVFTAAELARRHRERGLRLNAPEAIALIADAMFEAARGGATFTEVEAAGKVAVRPDEVLPGVPSLVDEVRLEVLLGDGTRLIVLLDPLGAAASEPDGPGSVILAGAELPDPTAALERRQVEVRSTSTRVIHVSSHFPPAGGSARWAPGEVRAVTLVRYASGPGDPPP